MKIKYVIFILLLCSVDLLSINRITSKKKQDFKKLEIRNGRVKYIKKIGYGIIFDHQKPFISKEIDLFFDFDNNNIDKDVTAHYKIKKYNVKYVPSMKLNNTPTGGFINYKHGIIVKVNKNNYLSNKVDMGSFFIDFYIHPSLYKNATILKKGVFYDNKFYGIIIELKKKRIQILFNNFFYDENNKSYSFTLKSLKRIKLKAWQHIGLIYNKLNGKISLFIDGKIDNEKYAAADEKFRSEILIPRFLKTDGSDLVLFKNYLGYIDNFRIGTTANIDFHEFMDFLSEEVIISSPMYNFKFPNSIIKRMNFKIKDHDKGIIDIFVKYGNRLKDINLMEWIEVKEVLKKKDRFILNEFNPKCKYFKWKIVMKRNPVLKRSPVFYNYDLNYLENDPPLPPKNIKMHEYDNKVNISWEKNLEEDLKGYVLYWGTKSKNYENKVDLGLENSYIIDSLKSLNNYYFTIRAYDSKDPYNYSAFSKEKHIYKK